MQLEKELEARSRVLLVGPPGCGKTARVHKVFADAGIPLHIWRPSIMERVDVSGVIAPDFSAGVARELPLERVAALRTATPENPVGLFLDDLGQAPFDVQAALMRLFEREALAPRAVIIWGATNRPHDKAGVVGLCEPLRSRFDVTYAVPVPGTEDRPDGPVLLSDWSGEVEAWCNWAVAAGLPPVVVAWHRVSAGRALYAWRPSADPAIRFPDYRAWEAVARRWNAGLRDLPAVAAAIGKGAATEFLAFARLQGELPAPDDVWADPEGAKVPSKGDAQILVATTLAAQVEPRTVRQFLRYICRLPRPITALAARDAYRRLGRALSAAPEWNSWFKANQELFQWR